MANRLTDAEIEARLQAVARHNGNQAAAARELGLTMSTFKASIAKHRAQAAPAPASEPSPGADAPAPAEPTQGDLLALLRGKGGTVEQLAEQLDASTGKIEELVDAALHDGYNIREASGALAIDKDIEPAYLGRPMVEYVSRPDNTYLFGACGDGHMGSKYARLDALQDLYRQYAEAGVDRVFNTGNWIDGEARFNKFDLLVHGMDAQCRYLAEHYPRIPGVTTYAVAGDDHEGWYGQREGVDIGQYAENTMRRAGRTDWVDLGYMEAHVKLTNYNTGKSSLMSVVHPGGGSAYALSYSIQKIIESLEGGEKPAVGLYGHYHKLWSGNIRNVWVVQTGTTEDQTPFMRKKRLEAHVGGTLIGLEQDPRTGAITSMTPKLIRYFNKGYYNDRWSHAHDINLPDRGAK